MDEYIIFKGLVYCFWEYLMNVLWYYFFVDFDELVVVVVLILG